MSSTNNIGIFGGDKRQVYIAKAFIDQGYNVYTFKISEPVKQDKCIELDSMNEMFDKCGTLIGPTPFIKTTKGSDLIPACDFVSHLKIDSLIIGGMLPPALVQSCSEKKIPYYDIMKNEKIAILNAIATAEGAIMEAIQSSEVNIHGSNCIVIGYGRCAKVLAEKLKGIGAKVTVVARSEEALAYAEASGLQTACLENMEELLPNCRFIFNTVPSLILDKCRLDLINEDAVIIDIASSPGGVDYEYAREKELNAKLCLGLPGKIAPKTSADIIVNEITKLLKERSV